MDIIVYATCPETGKSFEEEYPQFYPIYGDDGEGVIVKVNCPFCGEEHTFDV